MGNSLDAVIGYGYELIGTDDEIIIPDLAAKFEQALELDDSLDLEEYINQRVLDAVGFDEPTPEGNWSDAAYKVLYARWYKRKQAALAEFGMDKYEFVYIGVHEYYSGVLLLAKDSVINSDGVKRFGAQIHLTPEGEWVDAFYKLGDVLGIDLRAPSWLMSASYG